MCLLFFENMCDLACQRCCTKSYKVKLWKCEKMVFIKCLYIFIFTHFSHAWSKLLIMKNITSFLFYHVIFAYAKLLIPVTVVAVGQDLHVVVFLVESLLGFYHVLYLRSFKKPCIVSSSSF